jgi:alkyl sulfatase BDS1-like metallo-beta-lactamase superfamily hydrolase
MKYFISRTLLCTLIVLGSASLYAEDWKHYNQNPDFKPTTLPNGAITNFTAWAKVLPYIRVGPSVEVKAIPVTKNTWVITGYFYGPVIIETPKGLIVFSSGEHEGEGTRFREVIRRDVSKKPVIALFYDHAHYAKGAATLLDGDKAMIVAHPDSNRILRESGSLANPYIPELLPTLDGRADIHFGTHHPKNGPDATMEGTSLDLGKKSAWLPATKTLADGEEITIDGVTIQAFHAITDTEDSLTFWVPETKLVIDNVLWPLVPNLYTLRGDRYRDPQNWMKALRKIRELEPEVEICLGAGSLPLHGKEKILEATNALLDSVAYIYDQAIRLTNQGVPMDELGHRIHLPESVLKHPYVNEVYGQVETWSQAVAVQSHGWFSGYAEDIHRLPTKVYADNFIKLAGGAEKVLQAYNEAMTKGEYLWAKDLASELYNSKRDDAFYRQNLANVFRKLGQYSPGAIVRNFYTAAALSLEGNKDFSLGIVQPAAWVKTDFKRAVNALRTRINPQLAKGIEGVLSFDIDGQVVGLHVRNSVAEFVPDLAKHYRSVDAMIKVDGDSFTAYFRGELSANDMLAKAKTTVNSARLLALFDPYKQIPMYPTTELPSD